MNAPFDLEPRPTGLQLKAEIDALFERRPDLSRNRFGKLINGSSNGIRDVTKRNNPRRETVLKVRALIADPPEEAVAKVHPRIAAARARGCTLKGRRKASPGEMTREDYQVLCHIRARKVQRANRDKALARIAEGHAWQTAENASTRINQRNLEERLAEAARADDPIECALTALRRERHVIYRASVEGGSRDRFILCKRDGKKEIGEDELLSLARKVAA